MRIDRSSTKTTSQSLIEVRAMEVAHTRAQAATSSVTAKKRKVNNANEEESEELPSSTSFLKKPRRGVVDEERSVREAGNDDVSSSIHAETSCCSSNGSSEVVEDRNIKFVDLEVEGDQVESWTCNSSKERREMTAPSIELRAEAEYSCEVESTQAVPPRRRSSPKRMAVAEAELEEFFAAAEKDIQKQFLDKYNYDIVKDEPAEGRFEWVRLRP